MSPYIHDLEDQGPRAVECNIARMLVTEGLRPSNLSDNMSNYMYLGLHQMFTYVQFV